MNLNTLAFGMPGHMELLVILVIALLIFGKRLPEVGKSMGKSIVEFKKGLKGVKEGMDEVDQEINEAVHKAEQEAAQLENQSPTEASDQTKTKQNEDEAVV
ncbi:MAG: twin-arginine translocase TatA/TatE family subunit [Planctomycetota bacterium]